MPKPLHRARDVVLHAAVVLVLASLLQTLHLQRGNTLARNGNWTSSKAEVELGVAGATSAMLTRTALHRNRLNVGAWHAYHEYLHVEPMALAELEADFTLYKEDHFTFILNADASGFDGVRLSRHPHFPSACLSGTREGGFVHKQPLGVGAPGEGWHHLHVETVPDGAVLTLDGSEIGECRFAERAGGVPGRFGFRGSRGKRAYVDDVRAVGRDGKVIVETFENDAGAGRVFALALGGLLLVVGVVALAHRRRRGPDTAPLAFHLVATYLVLGFVIGLALAFDTFYLWKLHPYEIDFGPQETTIESQAQVIERLKARYPHDKADDLRRVLFVGSSQTWGSGARVRAEAFLPRLERRLNDAARDGVRYEVIDFAVSAYTAPVLYDLYVEQGVAWQPDTVVINLSNNDRDLDAFESHLRKFVTFNRERGIRTVFIPEPNTIENQRSFRKIATRHEVMRAVARELDVPLIEAHAALAEQADAGFLWWDRVHLTSFGQELFADLLFDHRALLSPGDAP